MKFGNLGIIKLPKDQLQMLLLLTQKNVILTHPNNNLILGGVTRDCVIELPK